MFKADRAVSLATETGVPLPHVPHMRDWYAEGAEFYRGSVVMVAGQPAAMKSMFALNLVHLLGEPTLYFSADSDAAVQVSRLAAMITGVNHSSIRDQMGSDPAQAARFREALGTSNVQFSFDSNPDAYDMETEISAWVELYDEYPRVIVVDNLRNIFTGQDSEHGGYKMVQQMLIDIARETNACVFTLHHMSESGGRKSTDPAPRSAIDGKVSQLPDLILSVAREADQFRLISIKNRHAVDHPEAEREHWKTLRVDAPTARFFAQDSLQSRANQFSYADAWKGAPLSDAG